MVLIAAFLIAFAAGCFVMKRCGADINDRARHGAAPTQTAFSAAATGDKFSLFG